MYDYLSSVEIVVISKHLSTTILYLRGLTQSSFTSFRNVETKLYEHGTNHLPHNLTPGLNGLLAVSPKHQKYANDHAFHCKSIIT